MSLKMLSGVRTSRLQWAGMTTSVLYSRLCALFVRAPLDGISEGRHPGAAKQAELAGRRACNEAMQCAAERRSLAASATVVFTEPAQAVDGVLGCNTAQRGSAKSFALM